MRIQSNFKDYYDIGMKFGQDQTLIYKRYQNKTEISKVWLPNENYQDFWTGPRIELESNIIGFAGLTYPLIKLLITPRGKVFTTTEARQNTKFLYSLEELDEQVDKSFPDHCKSEYWHGHITRRLSRLMFEKFFKRKDEEHPNFEKYSCPIFYYEVEDKFNPKYYIVTNGSVSQFNLIKILDPYQAYQQLAMYLGNQAEPRKPIPVMPDSLKITQHGYNKYSFRKDKSKK